MLFCKRMLPAYLTEIWVLLGRWTIVLETSVNNPRMIIRENVGLRHRKTNLNMTTSSKRRRLIAAGIKISGHDSHQLIVFGGA